MSTARPGSPGATRTCPHCKTTILESASVCPSCRGHLRFDSDAAQGKKASVVPFHVEGTIRHPAADGVWEYSVVLTIRNDRGEETTRQVIGVGALKSNEQRSFTLGVEVFEVKGVRPSGKGKTLR